MQGPYPGFVGADRTDCAPVPSGPLFATRLTVDSLREAMAGRSWNADSAEKLLDEHPESSKDIDQVMADQADLVSVQHTLRQVFNDKGV